jgi:hypothetical protein
VAEREGAVDSAGAIAPVGADARGVLSVAEALRSALDAGVVVIGPPAGAQPSVMVARRATVASRLRGVWYVRPRRVMCVPVGRSRR